jgi:hypothetical protein
MTTAEVIAARYDLIPSRDSDIGECPSCGCRGFTVTARVRRIPVYRHGGGCFQNETISASRAAELRGRSRTDLFETLDPTEAKIRCADSIVLQRGEPFLKRKELDEQCQAGDRPYIAGVAAAAKARLLRTVF